MSTTLFGFKKNEISKMPIKFLYISKAKYESDWHCTMHTHSFTELFYVLHGSGIFKIENFQLNVKENDLVIVNPHVSHTESSKDSNPLEYIVIGIDGLSLMTDTDDDSNSIHAYNIYNYSKYNHEILSYMNSLLYEVQHKEEYYEEICENLFEALILNMKRRTKSNLILSPTKDINKDCAFVKNYIDIHYSSDLCLDHLASITHMNKYYLIHIFKKFMQTTPIDYLIEKRTSVSKILLETTEYSMNQISQVVGFTSQSYFNQLFKKRVGVSPLKYRNQFNSNATKIHN
ncbi:AraC family transcriptional regulator [Clostridium sp. CF012]|uniref:AraC family transcriptional regulator n=1 Tax=Clostridium sp. CF012 TaxID=2843319 RepID=UPI001C0C617E|nr:AraC family transcriptional regulator [Clostridium sp. CF012]MBU3143365.1 AraC family transcriptional regulator [Clostridium sp. CF012]